MIARDSSRSSPTRWRRRTTRSAGSVIASLRPLARRSRWARGPCSDPNSSGVQLLLLGASKGQPSPVSRLPPSELERGQCRPKLVPILLSHSPLRIVISDALHHHHSIDEIWEDFGLG